MGTRRWEISVHIVLTFIILFLFYFNSVTHLKVFRSSWSSWYRNFLVIQKCVDCWTFPNIWIPNLKASQFKILISLLVTKMLLLSNWTDNNCQRKRTFARGSWKNGRGGFGTVLITTLPEVTIRLSHLMICRWNCVGWEGWAMNINSLESGSFLRRGYRCVFQYN